MGLKLSTRIKRIPFIERFFYRKLQKDLLNPNIETPVFVFQMGKVASSSITHSLVKAYKGTCIGGHTFSNDSKSYKIRALYDAYKKHNISIKIISLVREPVSRNMSAFFQNFERDTGYKVKDNPYSTEELLDYFYKNYNHKVPLEWFDRHIKYHFDIDVYSKSFPEDGFQKYSKKNIDLLLLRFDLEDSAKEKLISEFLDNTPFKIRSSNIGSKKDYSKMYSDFKKLPLSKEYVESMLNSKYSKHFYKNQIQDLLSKYL